jgi:hypothetical protein
MDSLIISHTAHESTLFVDGYIRTDEQFTNFLTELFPERARKQNMVKEILEFYPAMASGMSLFNILACIVVYCLLTLQPV